ncbi:transmembrane protein 199-like [Liolophura sinensis]|uniref:transmembrane protein 199-like n=1 Tax=Liolophura sinensis TaxID=3198878 RepID=UPI0031592BB0
MARESEVKLTDTIRKALQDAVDDSRISNMDKMTFKNILNEEGCGQKTIPFKTVRNLSKALTTAGKKVYIHELLKGSDVHLPSVDIPKRSPELEARLERLRTEAANREYEQMVGSIVPKSSPLDFSIGEDVKAINRQMTAVFNFVITVVAAFMFGYKGSELLLGVSNVAQKLTYGLVLGMAVFFADLYFLVKHTK